MWVFLVTEIMFFGGLFAAYTVYRSWYPQAFAEGGRHMDLVLGTINTGLLLVSSYTVVLALHAAQTDRQKTLWVCLLLTILLGLGFLGIKAYEYRHKFQEHHVPGAHFQLHDPPAGVEPRHVQLFYSLYFAMTGLHAAHMVIGVGLFSVILALAWRGHFSSAALHAGRNLGPVLALCRYRLGVSVPAVLPGRLKAAVCRLGVKTALSSHISRMTYTIVFAALMILLAVSIVAARYDLGNWNIVIALGISVAKAILITLFFMHVIGSSGLIRLVAVSGLLWLGFLMILTLSDYQTRHWVPAPMQYEAAPLDRAEPEPGY